jgi:hypothetical protein
MQSHTQTNPVLRKPDSLHFFRIVKEQPNKNLLLKEMGSPLTADSPQKAGDWWSQPGSNR